MELPHPDSHSCEACNSAIRDLQMLVAGTEGIDRARALVELGDAAVVGFRLDLALASFGGCLDLLPEGEFPDLESQALFKESCVLAEMGRFEEAIESIAKARTICRHQRDLEHLSLCEWREGVYWASIERTQNALELIAAARDRYLDLDLPAMAALVELDLQKATEEDGVRKPRSRRRRKGPPKPPTA